MAKKHYRLPDRSMTSDINVMIETWRAVYEPIETVLKPLGFRVAGYDPGLLFVREGGGSFDVPTDVAIVLSKELKEKK